MGFAFSALSYLIGYAPLLLVWIVAGVIAFSRWDRHPLVSKLVIAAVSLFTVEALIAAVVTAWLPAYLVQQHWTPSQIGVAFAVRGIVQGIVSAATWALIIVAIFAERAEARPAPPHATPGQI